jgi:hypothetical protein
MDNKNVFYGNNPGLYKIPTDRYDRTDFEIRLNNYLNCYNNFISLYTNTRLLENELKRFDLDAICHKEKLNLIDFGKKTEFKYENVMTGLDYKLEKLISKDK